MPRLHTFRIFTPEFNTTINAETADHARRLFREQYPDLRVLKIKHLAEVTNEEEV